MVNPNVTDRKFIFCDTLLSYPLPRLFVQCDGCNRYYAACCVHSSFGDDWYDADRPTCHHHQLVFTDGACSNNGRADARAGLGLVVGGNDNMSWSIPVDDTGDPGAPRTNQRAELLAAMAGLKKLHELNFGRKHKESGSEETGPTYIVVTDSEYVVKGITEWLPSWRRRNWRTSSGKQPTNLDLFRRLDEYITSLEREGAAVGFLHVPREYNHLADALSKRAAAA